MATNSSVYIHIPFCRHRCSYCDFNTYAGQEEMIAPYVTALTREIRGVGQSAGERVPVHTVFFGGGTPSLLAPGQVGQVLNAVRETFDLAPDAEISLEANPGTLSQAGLGELRSAGVNRLSMGMQSAHPDDLRLLERQHDPLDVLRSVQWARREGFEQISVDLMFSLPEQDLQRWERTVQFAIGMQIEHLSLYALTFEHGTPFGHWLEKGLIPLPDADLAADMYELAEERLANAGFQNYEISNWARQGSEGGLLACQHNLQYWRGLPYFGFGAGAHGYIDNTRTVNISGIRAYIQRLEQAHWPAYPASPAAISAQPIDRETEINETMMVGLRLTQEGIARHSFRTRFDEELSERFTVEIEECLKFGLVEWAGDAIRLTRRGRLLGNQVFRRFLRDQE